MQTEWTMEGFATTMDELAHLDQSTGVFDAKESSIEKWRNEVNCKDKIFIIGRQGRLCQSRINSQSIQGYGPNRALVCVYYNILTGQRVLVVVEESVQHVVPGVLRH